MESVQEITLFILLTVDCSAQGSLPRLTYLPAKSPPKSHIPSGDSCCQEAFHDFWPIFFSSDFQHYRSSLVRPDVWSEVWDRTKEKNVGTGHGAVHIPTAPNNSACLEKGEIPGLGGEVAGKPLRGRLCVTW